MARTGKNIYKRKDGRYEGRYIASRNENGKAKYACIYGKTRHEVEAKLIEAKAAVRAEQMKGRTTFAETAKNWLDDRRGKISEASVDRYEYLMDRYIMQEFGGKDISDVTMVQLKMYIAALADKEEHGEMAISGSTAESLLSIAGCVISFAQKEALDDLVLRNRERPEKNSYKPLSGDEIKRLVSCAKYNKSVDMLGIMLSLFTGIGTGELCALSWDDFDIDRCEISISHTLYRIKNKDSEEGGNRTKLTVMNVRRSAMRVVQYPKELDGYVREFYSKGRVFLTGERERYIEQRTFCNHMETALRGYNLSGVTIARIKKTYDAGLADVRYLTDPFYVKADGGKSRIQMRLDERWLIKEMENDLLSLRRLLGISSREMGIMMGVSEEEYEAIEAGEAVMDWDMFLAFLFLFRYNSRTEPIVDALGLYPNALRERIEIG